MTFRCDISATMKMQAPLDAVADMRYALSVLRELSLQKIESAGRARLAADQLQHAASTLEVAIDASLSALCQCAEVQESKTADKFKDLTFDNEGHCSKCSQCGLDGRVPYSRIENGVKVWHKPRSDY